MSTKKTTAAPGAPADVIYCDKTHASRSLFMPGGRELKVARGRVAVAADDAEVRKYLDGRRDFELLAQAV